MKKNVIAGLLVLLLLFVAALSGCGKNEPAVPENNNNNENMEPENQEPEDAAPAGPQYGGVLRGVRATF
ncbi:MAG TPA: hypothetical protein GX699_07040, partial [Firmicutes bacterium]|nr:hypothetical protein [Bacillota bacterium]